MCYFYVILYFIFSIHSQPACEYDVQLKTGDVNQHIERSAPKVKQVKVSNVISNLIQTLFF